MKKFILSLTVAAAALLIAQQDAQAGHHKTANYWGLRYARTMPWHGNYYYAPRGDRVALVVPPVAHMQTSMGWGVTQTSMRPIYHQFARPYPNSGGGGGMSGYCLPTPRWPSHTDQFGVYYVRGPW